MKIIFGKLNNSKSHHFIHSLHIQQTLKISSALRKTLLLSLVLSLRLPPLAMLPLCTHKLGLLDYTIFVSWPTHELGRLLGQATMA